MTGKGYISQQSELKEADRINATIHPLVQSSAFFDLSPEDLEAARRIGLDLTSPMARDAAEVDFSHVIPDEQSIELQKYIQQGTQSVQPTEDGLYRISNDGRTTSITNLSGDLLYRKSGDILLQNQITYRDAVQMIQRVESLKKDKAKIRQTILDR